MPLMRIAITGGIAEGKSTVLAYLDDLGYSTASGDLIARDVFHGAETQRRLSELLGVRIAVSPQSLRDRLSDPVIRRGANSIMHPAILAGIRAATATFVEVPLLVETCLQGEFDRIWVVSCGYREQLQRLTDREGNEVVAEALIRTQLASRAKIPFADRLIRTNQPETSVKRLVTVAAQRELR